MTGYVVGTLSGAVAMTAPLSLRNAVVASTATNTGLNIKSQYAKYDEIKYPAELAVNASFGLFEGLLGRYFWFGMEGHLWGSCNWRKLQYGYDVSC
ncbi:hypothetical protein [Methylotenera sp. L2L1]|uniref:hypothetical protein n=1 Tax=Methylotenera sp. L2L1 TaxID=1502770 RepID=UPI00055B9052|nr:hypothetical protein [Methylotenera sp. L2L1]